MIDPQDLLDTLILEGALVIQGVDEYGEILYGFTEKLAELAPELYKEFTELIHSSVMSLWEKGFVTMNVMDESPVIAPTEMALDRRTWEHLSDNELQTMIALMKAFEGDI